MSKVVPLFAPSFHRTGTIRNLNRCTEGIRTDWSSCELDLADGTRVSVIAFDASAYDLARCQNGQMVTVSGPIRSHHLPTMGEAGQHKLSMTAHNIFEPFDDDPAIADAIALQREFSSAQRAV